MFPLQNSPAIKMALFGPGCESCSRVAVREAGGCRGGGRRARRVHAPDRGPTALTGQMELVGVYRAICERR